MASTISVMICALHIISLMTRVDSYYEPDKISKLPGQPDVDFRQYSGYVTVDEKHERSYFYYFVEAEKDPASKPLVLWLIGGPGCSSVGVGAFSENGPFHPRGNILIKNEYSINKVANMLYLESPAGVGFSYSVDKSFYKSVNDEMTAMDNFIFLQNWFKKFPEFKAESFSSREKVTQVWHYAPQLAHLIVQYKPKQINLKGIAVGNPLLEFNTDFNARAEYLWSHGLISDFTFDQLNTVCNYSQIRRQNQSGEWTPECSRVNSRLTSEMGRYVDIFDVTLDVCLSTVSNQSQVQTQLDGSNIDVCVIEEMKVYMARKDVQKALHARLVGVPNWTPCSAVMHYDMLNLEIPTIGLLGSLVKSGVRVLAYSGDQDSLLPLSGTRKLIMGLANDLKLTTTRPYGSWMSGKQVGGWTQDYGNYLSFATMRGASHFAAISQPERALDLLDSFISGKPLPPPPVNE